MYTFNYPTEVKFGLGCVAQELAKSVAQLNMSKILLVTDEVLVKIGLAERVTALLDEAGVAYELFSNVIPENPKSELEAAAATLLDKSVDGIVALGGGSSIDFAKVINLMLTKQLTSLDKHLTTVSGYWCNEALLPMIAIPTTSGTGSEISPAAGVKDTVKSRKESLYGMGICPRMALVDGEYHAGMPASVTMSTGLDALSHALEPFFSRGRNKLTSCFGLQAIEQIVDNLPKAVEDGSNLEVRQNMAEASVLALMAGMQGMTHIGHGISHATGGKWYVPHGIATAHVLFPMVEYLAETAEDSVVALSKIFGAEPSDNPGRALRAAIEKFAYSVGLPKLGSFDRVDLSQLDEIAEEAVGFIQPRAAMLGKPVPSVEWIKEAIEGSI